MFKDILRFIIQLLLLPPTVAFWITIIGVTVVITFLDNLFNNEE